jgi:hypothetical protein
LQELQDLLQSANAAETSALERIREVEDELDAARAAQQESHIAAEAQIAALKVGTRAFPTSWCRCAHCTMCATLNRFPHSVCRRNFWMRSARSGTRKMLP